MFSFQEMVEDGGLYEDYPDFRQPARPTAQGHDRPQATSLAVVDVALSPRIVKFLRSPPPRECFFSAGIDNPIFDCIVQEDYFNVRPSGTISVDD